MYKTCITCDKTFTTISKCLTHKTKQICLKRIDRKREKMKNQMKICKRCNMVFSNEHTLSRHSMKQKKCPERSLEESLDTFQKDFIKNEKNKIIKMKLKKEVLCEHLDIKQNKININIFEKPVIANTTDSYDELSREELLLLVKEKHNNIDVLNSWTNNAWKLIKEINPRNIVENVKEEEVIATRVKDKKEVVVSHVKDNKKKEVVVTHVKDKKEDIVVKEEKNIVSRVKEEWDSLLSLEDKKHKNLEYLLDGHWDSDNYIISPVRHYADHFDRRSLIRNINNAKMLSGLICPYFYPKYKSSLNTKAYINNNKKKSLWLLVNDKWQSVSLKDGIKNMIFHAVSAYEDLIRREDEVIPSGSISDWAREKDKLISTSSEDYKHVSNSIIKRIPSLSIHPEIEEKKLADVYLNDTDFKLDILEELQDEIPNYCKLSFEESEKLIYSKTISKLRHEYNMSMGKKCHLIVDDYFSKFG